MASTHAHTNERVFVSLAGALFNSLTIARAAEYGSVCMRQGHRWRRQRTATIPCRCYSFSFSHSLLLSIAAASRHDCELRPQWQCECSTVLLQFNVFPKRATTKHSCPLGQKRSECHGQLLNIVTAECFGSLE